LNRWEKTGSKPEDLIIGPGPQGFHHSEGIGVVQFAVNSQ
jgi:hypothetical protein